MLLDVNYFPFIKFSFHSTKLYKLQFLSINTCFFHTLTSNHLFSLDGKKSVTNLFVPNFTARLSPDKFYPKKIFLEIINVENGGIARFSADEIYRTNLENLSPKRKNLPESHHM